MSIWGWLGNAPRSTSSKRQAARARGARRRRRSAMPAPFVTGKRSGKRKVPWGGYRK